MSDNVTKAFNIIDTIDLDSLLHEVTTEEVIVESACTCGKKQVCPCDDPVCLESDPVMRRP